ncbi:MAG: competence/damage-inducible protein A [Myxococcales bacterium]|nr:competence/damage-inducible protein A [Myxococcales bacterium]
MTAAVVSIGTELTRGELVDTNSAWIAEQLTALGLEVIEKATVDDDLERIVKTLERVASDVDVVITTGGLGPTSDDLTTAAAARAARVPLERDPAEEGLLRAKFEAAGRPMPESNLKQVDFPRGAEVLPNPSGTAPGFALRLDGAEVFVLPGVPSEMQRIFDESIAPRLAPRVQRTTYQVHLRTFGLTESGLAERLAGVERDHPGVTLGYRASFPEIEVKVHARAAEAAAAQALAQAAAQVVRGRLGAAVYGDRDATFAGEVGRLLRNRGLTLAVAESCTGGLVGAMLTDVPGSSDFLLLDAVTYANSAKTAVLGVSAEVLCAHGAVSGETAQMMAEGALRVSGADLAVATTGIAGPGGGTEDKPVGTVWFAIAKKDGEVRTAHRLLRGGRARIRTLAAYVALELVRRAASDAPAATSQPD